MPDKPLFNAKIYNVAECQGSAAINGANVPLVFGKGGLYGRLEPEAANELMYGQVVIRLEDGQKIQVSKVILSAQKDGSFLLPLSLEALEQAYNNHMRVEER